MPHTDDVCRLDQKAAIDEDEDAFDPDQNARDYDEVARSLSVFCVSARAYQKLSGRLKKDSVHVDGFTAPEDTEIPQLQEHAKRLTEGGRASTSRRSFNDRGTAGVHHLEDLQLCTYMGWAFTGFPPPYYAQGVESSSSLLSTKTLGRIQRTCVW